MSKEVLGLNVCVLAGEVHRPPQWRELPAGGSVTTFDVKVRVGERPANVVRVSWLDAPTSAMDLNEGETVVVCGTLRSYWVGRLVTDMSCTSVTRSRASATVRKNISQAIALLQAACP